MPLVVIECKDVNSFTSNPMYQGIEQLSRYADLREKKIWTYRGGEPKLFYTNQLMISIYGDDAKFGTVHLIKLEESTLTCFTSITLIRLFFYATLMVF